MLPFVEERLAITETLQFAPIIPDTTGGNQWSTTRIEQDNGFVHVHPNWDNARWKGTLGGRKLFKDDFEYLRNFYLSRRGKLQGFRYKNWEDFKRDEQLIGYTTGGPQTIQLRTDQRVVTKPVPGTVMTRIGASGALNPVPNDRWTINYTTGQLYVDTLAAGIGQPIYAKFEFDIPVRFNTDFRYRYEAIAYDHSDYAVTIDALELIELSPSTAPNYNPDYVYGNSNPQRWRFLNERYGACVPSQTGEYTSKSACEAAHPIFTAEEIYTFCSDGSGKIYLDGSINGEIPASEVQAIAVLAYPYNGNSNQALIQYTLNDNSTIQLIKGIFANPDTSPVGIQAQLAQTRREQL